MSKKNTFSPPQLSAEELSKALYEVTQKLEQSNRLLKETQQQKDLLFANISHDLRSPVTAIRTSIEYLLSLENITREELTASLELMQRRSIYLEHLINDVFLLSSISANTKKLHMETIPISFLLEEFFFTVSEDTRFEQRNLYLEVPEDLDCFVSIDTKMFWRVLDNLFTNALKYSNENASITLGAIKEDSRVHIFVTDTGIGMEEKHLQKIFDTSYMIEDARTPSSSTGTGLGLAIVKATMESFHGNVWCESQVNKGSTFHITLPLVSPPDSYHQT